MEESRDDAEHVANRDGTGPLACASCLYDVERLANGRVRGHSLALRACVMWSDWSTGRCGATRWRFVLV